MPDDALPQPWVTIPGLVHYERSYLDLLGRPMRGTVRISGGQRAEHDDAVTVPSRVTVELVAGRLVLDLPAGDYELAATLSNADDVQAKITETVTLTA